MDLLEVAKKCCQGDTSSWEQFLPVYADLGHRVLRTFRLPEATLEDILSKTLLKLYDGGLQQFRGSSVGELVVYLKQVIRNEALTFVSRQGREIMDPEALVNLPSDNPTVMPIDIIADEECLKILENIVSLLPKRERELFLMKSRGMKEREIATQMDSPPGTIASWISRMIKQIQEELQKHNCLH